MKSGPHAEGSRNKKLARQFRKENIWRLRIGNYRLIYKWVNGTMTLLRLRIRNESTYRRVLTTPDHLKAGSEKDAKLRAILDLAIRKDDPEETPKQVRRLQTPRTSRPETFQEGAPPLEKPILEAATPADLLDDYKINVPLLCRFGRESKWPEKVLERIKKCKTTDEVLGLSRQVSEEAEDMTIQFLLETHASSDLERLYCVAEEHLESIVHKPLDAFLLLVDEEQKKAIERNQGARPFLVTGAAGTGKSIVGLYRMLRLIQNRSQETLFDKSNRPIYRMVTYTNALVGSLKSLWNTITHDVDIDGIEVIFSTADSWLIDVSKQLGEIGVPLHRLEQQGPGTMISGAFWMTVRDSLVPSDLRKRLENLGQQFFSDEVEEILVDRGIEKLSEYLEVERAGRRFNLRRSDRRAIWVAFEKLIALVTERKKAPFCLWRRSIFQAVSEHRKDIDLAAAVFIDEVQDFSHLQIATLVNLTKSPGGVLLASDPGQSIYRRSSSWQKISGVLKFTSANAVVLRRSYRMTRQIHDALQPIRDSLREEGVISRHQASPVFTGPTPEWLRAPASMHPALITKKILEWTENSKRNHGRIAILLLTLKATKGRFLDAVRSELRIRNIPHEVNNRDRAVDVGADAVHILTAHSAKGMEFPLVIIPFSKQLLSQFDRGQEGVSPDSEELDEKAKRLFYTACSRAAERLAIIEETDRYGGCLDILRTKDWIVEEFEDPETVTVDNEIPF